MKTLFLALVFGFAAIAVSVRFMIGTPTLLNAWLDEAAQVISTSVKEH